MPDGSTAQFNVWESKVMEQGLTNAFPTIKTYAGQGITDKSATIRFDMTEMGFHAIVLSPFTGSVFIDPYDQITTTNYIVYYKKNFSKKDAFLELPQIKSNDKGNTTGNTSKAFPAGQCIGNQRRNYRLAIACTYQYAQAATGLSNPTKAQVLAKIVTTVNRVTGVYEQEVGIHFNLVANNQNIIYTTAASDTALGQFNSDPYSLAPKSHSHITLIIGSANFDLGQTFSTGAGGLVINGNPTGVACDNDYKASAVTGQPNPVGDPYDIDFVAHEIGHQFNSNHTFNANTGDCFDNTNSFSATTATNCEPGSGSTIMAYAGICDEVGIINDLQPHSDPQFHAISIAEILDYSIQDIGNNCPIITATGNNAPIANAGSDYTIPINTPFILTGTGSDPDNDAISYSWEEIDVFGAIGNWNATQTANIPLFRSFTPKNNGIRYLPQISDVVNVTTTIGERLPSISRTMKFRLTVRDNKAGGGGTCFDDALITVNNTGGAFAVTSQNTNGIVCIDGETRTVTWSKGSTSSSPFNVVNVTIELSVDGGYTFPVTLVASTPNDGTENIIIPANFTTTARIRVRALNNIFYAINSKNFTIKVNPAPVKWLSVAAQKEKNKTVKILWTVNEIENSYYDVERSVDGNKFEKIITVDASKENGNNHNYAAIDIKPIIGKNYYRIKQVDKDGHYTYSIVVFVMIDEANNSFTIYPNPATSNINLYSNANFYKADIQMFDAIGRLVFAQINKDITKGSIININLSNLSKGVYSIRIQSDNNETIVKKLILQ
ncbi:unnamed protein product [Rotaria sp. Silwood1]|nr:unnamed protein product [Rotaria sp. Silwood1]CAF4892660.1 unnamed protein product [Rotaria sp. Silwood1]